MARPARTLLFIVGIGLVGLLVLTWMARRYAKLPQAPPAEAAATAPAPAPAEAPPPTPETPAAVAPSEADLRDLDRFVAVRTALQKVIAEQPKAAAQLAEQLKEGDPSKTKPLQFNLVFLMKFRLTREEAIQNAAWDLAGYRSVRAEFEGWLAGTAPADPARAAAFEARRKVLEKAGLGGLEALDRVADSGAEG